MSDNLISGIDLVELTEKDLELELEIVDTAARKEILRQILIKKEKGAETIEPEVELETQKNN